MLEFPRLSVLKVSDFPSRNAYEAFDAKALEQHPVVFRRGKVRYKLGVVRRAYKGRDEILADILLLGGFKGAVKPKTKTDEFEIKSIELILE